MHLQRQRYILFEFLTFKSQTTISEKDIIKSVWSSMIRLFGEYNSYFSGLWMIKYDVYRKWGVIRCNNKTKEKVISALALITKIKGVPVLFHTIRTSGTIKKILKVQKEYFLKNRVINS